METMILSEELKIGEKLPPERDIAHKMQISRSVVNDGIAALSKMGFLTIVPRYGTYVADYKSHGTIDILVAIMKNGNVSNSLNPGIATAVYALRFGKNHSHHH